MVLSRWSPVRHSREGCVKHPGTLTITVRPPVRNVFAQAHGTFHRLTNWIITVRHPVKSTIGLLLIDSITRNGIPSGALRRISCGLIVHLYKKPVLLADNIGAPLSRRLTRGAPINKVVLGPLDQFRNILPPLWIQFGIIKQGQSKVTRTRVAFVSVAMDRTIGMSVCPVARLQRVLQQERSDCAARTLIGLHITNVRSN